MMRTNKGINYFHIHLGEVITKTKFWKNLPIDSTEKKIATNMFLDGKKIFSRILEMFKWLIAILK